MSRRFAWLTLFLAACTRPVVEGGSNANDRSNGGDQGETLLTGAMVISPDGKFVVAQRNQTSVLLDVDAKSARELPEQVDRFVFKRGGGRGIAVLQDNATVVEYDLATISEQWRVTPAFRSSAGATLARLTDDDQNLVVGDEDRFFVFDTARGDLRGTVSVGSVPTELSFTPGTTRALVAGTTRWVDHKPQTDVIDVDLPTLSSTRVVVPNCSAPIVVLPDASRALLSPTFCEEGQVGSPTTQWTNPDPVSVIDLMADGPHFLKNLPGFGPVAIDADGRRAVAYLDVERMDETMFEDKSKVPSKTGARYHIMTIDPASLVYDLSPIGSVLPRFAMARSGQSLLVDATVQQLRGEAKVRATLDTSGHLVVNVQVFGSVNSLFGSFDLDGRTYAPFGGPAASLDRFVQMGDAARVFTLKATADGMGGDLYRIDLAAKTAASLGTSLRDIGLFSDGKTMLLRERLPAVQVQTSAGSSWYRREKYCFSLDGMVCFASVEFQDSKPFQTGPTCTSYHDC
jgi:hypothetical protein